MTQFVRDLFAIEDRLMSVDEAVALLAARLTCLEDCETVDLAQAEGRILAQDLVAPIDLPSFDNSAVDGYAVRAADLTSDAETILPVAARVAAGHPLAGAPPEKAAVRIFTGAPVPAGFDTIIMQEECTLGATGEVVLPAGVKMGANCRRRGEDLTKGARALAAGRRLAPEDLGLAAALGQDRLTVRRRLRAAVFSTGDEIVAPGVPLPDGGVYDANRFMLIALLRRQGVLVTDLGILADDREVIAQALAQAAQDHDLVITSGGVSIGEEDHVKAAVARHGALVFWRLAIKPGKPIAMGIVDGTPFIGLPGNPAAVFITFIHIVRPVIAALNGAQLEPPRGFDVVAGFSYRKKPGRREYVRAALRRNPQGVLTAEKYPTEGSGILTSLTRTQGLVELREDLTAVAAGDIVPFLDYDLVR